MTTAPRSVSDRPSEATTVYENTYKMTPDRTPALIMRDVRKRIQDILHENLSSWHYDADVSSHMTKQLAERVKEEMKGLAPKRYKVVTFVALGCHQGSDLCVGSRCLWDPKVDQFHEEKYENSSVFAVVTVYVLYME
ncbi:Hypothetical predicted protein [Argonauta hians]